MMNHYFFALGGELPLKMVLHACLKEAFCDFNRVGVYCFINLSFSI